MNVAACSMKHHFNLNGNLSEDGKAVFWRDLDHLIKRYDRNEIQLLPAPHRNAYNTSRHANQQRAENSKDRFQ